MSEHKITIPGGESVRLLTAGKYCDRDIVVTAEGGTVPEDLNAVLTEQEALIAELQDTLKGKAGGSGGGSDNYAKITATTSSTTSITIDNPLGGVAKIVSIKAISPTVTSSRKIHECCLSSALKIGAIRAYYTDSTVDYVVLGTDGSPTNAQFSVTEGSIVIYRFNSATTWDTTCGYEVEIWQ